MIIYADPEKMEGIKERIQKSFPNVSISFALVISNKEISEEEIKSIGITAMMAGALSVSVNP